MEQVSISGYVNFNADKLSIVKVFSDKFENIGIKEGYLSSTFSKISEHQMELSVFGECLISDSSLYREILFNISKAIDKESSILLKVDGEKWSSVATLKPRDSSIVVQKIHVADNTVTKVPN